MDFDSIYSKFIQSGPSPSLSWWSKECLLDNLLCISEVFVFIGEGRFVKWSAEVLSNDDGIPFEYIFY